MKNGSLVVIVMVAAACILVLSTFLGGPDEALSLYSAPAPFEGTWNRPDVPDDRWIGIARVDDDLSLVAYMGAMPTGGYAIHVREVTYDKRGETPRLSIHLAVASPGPDDAVIQAFTYPTDVVSIEDWPEVIRTRLLGGSLLLDAVDQDGRDWGPVKVADDAAWPAVTRSADPLRQEALVAP